MDRAGGHTAGELCAAVWRSALGFYCESFRFEGGGRQYNRGRLFRRYTNFRRSNSFNYMKYFVVGLNRTGKSCRLRWVNYLHPGLKRGKMTPQEERLVLELHAKWGNRFDHHHHHQYTIYIYAYGLLNSEQFLFFIFLINSCLFK